MGERTTSKSYYKSRPNNTWIFYFSWLTLFCFLAEFKVTFGQWKKCPKECVCSSSWLRGVTSVVVDCSKRGLHHIPTDGVPSDVTSFVLNENFIQEVPRDAFKGYRYLRELYLYKNFISKVDREAFRGLRRLQVLSLHTNRLRRLENGTFEGLASLKRLYLFSNFLEEVRSSTFDGIGGLTTMFLHENHLRQLTQDTFSALINLQVLTLYRNYLTELHRGDFLGLNSLVQLYMHQNKISFVSNFAFEGCKKLRKITLGNNLLTNITKGAFLGLPWMEELYLDKNKIDTIEDESFVGMFGLRKLALQSNRIKSIKNGAFTGLRGLLVLSLAANDIRIVEDGMFNGLKYLRQLFLHDNKISDIKPGSLSQLSRLIQLYLYRNHLQILEAGTFQGLVSLLELNLGVNNISAIENDAFKGLRRLQMLLLNSNRLRIVPAGAFKNLPLLRKLYLYFNEISYVEEDAFKSLVDIDEIAWYPPTPLLRARPQLAKILSNRLRCDCNALWLRKWLAENDHVRIGILCHEPGRKNHLRNVTDVAIGNFTCNEPSQIVISPGAPIVEAGKTVQFNCFMEPGGQIQWMRNGSVIKSNSTRGMKVASSGLLQIQNVQKEDRGEYVCMVGNKAGILASSVKLQIGVPPRIIRKSQSVMTVESPGQSVVLECEAIGSPKPLITWSMGGFPLRDGFDKFISHRGDLIILNMKIQDQGIYQCEVWNELGRDSVATQLYLGQGTKCLPSCLYGGFCIAKYICQCLPTFTGEYCESRITDAVIPSLGNSTTLDEQSTDEDQGSGWLDSFTASIGSGESESKKETKEKESGHDVDNTVGSWDLSPEKSSQKPSAAKPDQERLPFHEEHGYPGQAKSKKELGRQAGTDENKDSVQVKTEHHTASFLLTTEATPTIHTPKRRMQMTTKAAVVPTVITPKKKKTGRGQ